MPFDERLAERVRKLLAEKRGFAERKMFGGICFLIDGHMCCGVIKGRLVVRVGPDAYDRALAKPHARPMDFTGKPLRGFVYVMPAGLAGRAAIKRWVGEGLRFVGSLAKR